MSKKALVRFDPKNPSKQSSDFLCPLRNETGSIELASLIDGRIADYGLVVFTGREITSNDLFAKLVESGKRIASVDQVLADLNFYVENLGAFGIGTVLQLKKNNVSPRGFSLVKTDLKPRKTKPRDLP